MYKKPISEVISMIVGFGLYHKFAAITWLHMHQVKLWWVILKPNMDAYQNLQPIGWFLYSVGGNNLILSEVPLQ